jgi:hypothetical protein
VSDRQRKLWFTWAAAWLGGMVIGAVLWDWLGR